MPKVTEAYLKTRRQQILDAAIACFARKGFHQTTMEDIGNEAGLSPGVAYRYFDNKEDIILATIEDSVDRSGHLYKTMADDEMDTRYVLEQMIDDSLLRLEQPGKDIYYKVRVQLWGEVLQNPKVAERAQLMREKGLEHSAAVIRKGQERNQINPELDAMTVSITLAAIHDGFVIHWLADPDVDIQQHRKVLMKMLRSLFNR